MSAVSEQGHLDRVYVWEWPVRLAHWLFVGTIIILAVTGIYIGNPFLTVEGEATRHFVMGTMKTIHFVAAMIFLVAVFGRMLWMFAGNPYARWRQFVPIEKKRLVGIFQTAAFYMFLKKESPAFVGHNPLAGMVYVAVFGLFFVMIGTGFALMSASATVGSVMGGFDFLIPLFGGLQLARFIHHVCMWLIIGFAAHHVWSAYLVGSVEGSSLIDSIFSGYKVLSPDIAKRAEKHIEEDK